MRANFSDVVLWFVRQHPGRTRNAISRRVARWRAVAEPLPGKPAVALALLRAHLEGTIEITTWGLAERAWKELVNVEDDGLIEQADDGTLHITAAGQERLRARGLP